MRQDSGMAELLQYENVAWYQDGAVRILDRRTYPYKKNIVTCKTYRQVAQAIRDMVTQSGGPYTAAAMGMALAAHECKDRSLADQKAFLTQAARTLATARPTTARKMGEITAAALEVGLAALESGRSAEEAIFDQAFQALETRYATYRKVADHLVRLIPDQGTVMTMCFAETIVGTMLQVCRQVGKTPRFICPETRPYLQGARLTASVIAGMGFEVSVITDNMPAWIMQREKVDLFTSAADVITLDGHVVNKVGTLQVALAAHHWGIPYFVTGSPSRTHKTTGSVIIEERDAGQVTDHLGTRVVAQGVGAFYPAFDITPPTHVSGVVTRKGIFSPYDLETFFVGEENVTEPTP